MGGGGGLLGDSVRKAVRRGALGHTILGDLSEVGARSPGRYPARSTLDPSGGYTATKLLNKFSGRMNLHGQRHMVRHVIKHVVKQWSGTCSLVA